ncbi:sugar transferase [Spirochaetia bacterium]|nr:sugar transferase [Spirochaetia bacterium]
MYKFTIVTPTYNRAHLLQDMYISLKEQSEHDFEWIIVDDGSTDNTRNVVAGFEGLSINYVYQENAGKPGAVNKGIGLANSYISTILDDDDILLPNALEIVWGFFDATTEHFKNNCVVLSGHNIDKQDNSLVGAMFPSDNFVSDNISCRFNKHIGGDKCEFYITSVLKKYPFPIFNNEKFITEAVVWNRIALKYNALFVNKVFKRVEYLSDGLSANYRNLMLNNPEGAEIFFNEASTRRFNLDWQIRHSAIYIKFAKKNKRKRIFLNAGNKIIYPAGLCLYFLKEVIRKK